MKISLKCCFIITFLFLALSFESNGQEFKNIWSKVKKEVNKEIRSIKNNKKKEPTKEEIQAKKKKELDSFDFGEELILKSPNNSLKPIVFQTHKGLLRFGYFNTFGIYSNSELTNNSFLSNKLNQYRTAPKEYQLMLKIKELHGLYKYLNTDILYSKPVIIDGFKKAIDNPLIKREKQDQQEKSTMRSWQGYLQNWLLEVASNFLIEEEKSKYIFRSIQWKGLDEFERLETYQNFCDEYLDVILNWSLEFMVQDELECFYVVKMTIGKYSFETNSFSLGGSRENRITYLLEYPSRYIRETFYPFAFGRRVPKHNFELNPSPGKLSLSMPLEEAKKFNERNESSVYIVTKVKWERDKKKKIGNVFYEEPEYRYSFSEPNAIVYSDEALTEEIGQIMLFSK